MILHAFYNLDHVGDVLLVRLGQGQTDSYQKNDDVICLCDQDKKIIGFNVLNASKYFEHLNTGLVKIDEAFVNALNQLLTRHNLEPVEADLTPKFLVGEVLEMEDHPDSDHLHVCQVSLGKETVQIVCGAPNVAAGQKVVVATIGAVMPSGLIIKPSRLRKVDSKGMLCSARELNLKDAPQERGILILDDHYVVGDSFY